LRSKGYFDRAMRDYDKALGLNPGLIGSYQGRCIIWREQHDLDRALAECSRAIALDSSDFDTFNIRGLIYGDKGELDRAISDFNETIRLNPKMDQAFANRGNVWRLKGDLVKALKDQDESLRLRPRSLVALVSRGETFRYKGDLDSAIADFQQALRFENDYLPALTGLGLTYEKMNDPSRAREQFQKALDSQSVWKAIDSSRSARDTARARLAALASGTEQPSIPAAPTRVTNQTSIPTPVLVPSIVKPSSAMQGRRVALVIGNSGYKNVPALTNPLKDAEAVAASLRNIGFETVTLIVDATREKLLDVLRAFGDEAEKADWAMVYYAGHGIEVNGQNYLIPVDARLAADRDVQFEAVPLDQVMASLEGARKLKLVLLDACRDNPFAPQMRKSVASGGSLAASTAGGSIGTRSIGRGLGEVKVQGASLVVFAAKHGQTALDGEGGNSPFAVAMVQRVATPGVEINKIFRLVRDDVMEATAGRQEPYTYGSLPGKEDFFFVAAK
jgi:tetratricopeptide (TPR) repeat protein